MAKEKKKSGSYRRAFFAGMATLLPTILTLYILFFCYSFLSDRIAKPINSAMVYLLKTEQAREWYWKGLWNKRDNQLDDSVPKKPEDRARLADTQTFDELVQSHVPHWLGFVAAVVLVLVVGFLFKGYLGRQMFRSVERLILSIPIIKVIYPYAKQVTEFFFEEKKQLTYDSAVCLEYPRKGIFSLGFVTNEGLRDVSDHVGEEMVSVFIPSSPTPMTGYTIQVPRKDLITLSVGVDEALRYAISGGVILPPSQLPPLALKTKRLERPANPQPAEIPENTSQS